MKLLVIGIDAVSPRILFDNLNKFPHIKKLASNSIQGSYMGYTYGYGSRDNWITMYTGLTPEEHGTRNNIFLDTGKNPRLYQYNDKNPFWKELNKNGYKVGLWKAISTSPPEELDGYIASGEYAFEEEAKDSEIWNDNIEFHSSLKELQDMVQGVAPEIIFPKGIAHIEITEEQLKNDPSLLLTLMKEDYFEESLGLLREMLQYNLINIEKVNEYQKVDLFWFYDLIFDFISHFQMHDPNHKVIVEALVIIDDFVGKLIKILKPENVIFLSDHGQLSFGDHFPNMSIETRKEAFGLANQSYFVDEHIFLPARNGGVMSAAHSSEATLIASGPLFDKEASLNNEYRTIDIYPLIMEIFNCKMPEGRKGYVPSILKKETYVNEIYPLHIQKQQVLIIANRPVYEMNSFINQYFLKNRFHKIHVLAEDKYLPAYQVNPQIEQVYSMQNYTSLQKKWDKIILPTENTKYSLNYEEYLNRK